MDIFKITFIFIIPSILFLFAYGAYDYGTIKKVFQPLSPTNVTYQTYIIEKTSEWKHRFNNLDPLHDYNTVKRRIVGNRQNYLEVRRHYETYLIQSDAQVDDIIKHVKEVKEQSDKTQYTGRYFLVQYDRFVEIVYFDITKSTTPLSTQVQNGTYEAEVCLQLQIQASTNAKYHIDQQNNIWIVTVSMNKVVFIQIYSCIEKRLINQFRYILNNQEFVNQPLRIIKASPLCMNIQVLTYSLKVITVQVCPYDSKKSIREFQSYITHKNSFSEVVTDDFDVFQGYSVLKEDEQFNNIIDHIKNIVAFYSNNITDTKSGERQPSNHENLLQQFDSIVIDQDNHYLINFSQNTTYTGILALNKYLINAKAPLFHNNPNYDRLSLLKILDREDNKEFNSDFQHKYLVPGINITKKMFYKAAYRVYPDLKVQHIGIGSSIVYYHPKDKIHEKQYSFVRTNEGGVVSQGLQFKGVVDKVPYDFQEVYQVVDTKALEVIPNIFQAHIGYANYMTKLYRTKTNQFNRIQLVNMVGGKAAITHYLSIKQGYKYVSTMILNNQWWILQYSSKIKQSKATKYEIYVNVSSPAHVIYLKRVYGVRNSQEHLNKQDDLAALMNQFVAKYNKGYIFLSIYRCIDEYYYIEYTDQTGNHYGIARIHFKNFSNRRIKQSQRYSGVFQRVMLVDESIMIPQRNSRTPYSVVIKDINLFKHVPKFIDGDDRKQSWFNQCQNKDKGESMRKLQKIGGFFYFPMNYYAKGNYGCEYNSDKQTKQIITGFNMRNIIINGKLKLQNKSQIRLSIITKIIYCFPVYIFIIVIFFMISKLTNKQVKAQSTDKTKQIGEKKTEKTEKKKKIN